MIRIDPGADPDRPVFAFDKEMIPEPTLKGHPAFFHHGEAAVVALHESRLDPVQTKLKKAELKQLVNEKADEKKNEIFAAIEASGKSYEDVLEMIKNAK